MQRFLLDTNHLADLVEPVSRVRRHVFDAIVRGDRMGTCLPVLCEWYAGLQQSRYRQQRRRMLNGLLRRYVRIWPLDQDTAEIYGELFGELRAQGRVLSQVDIMLAALARQSALTLLTSDQDFTAVAGIQVENWLAAP
jgi:predicted nucleic acid-binding protein